jgi:spermidine/putrescine-binding protein
LPSAAAFRITTSISAPIIKDIIDSAKEPPRGQVKNWFAPYVLTVMGLVYNTKEASKPASYQDLLNPKYKGRVGILGRQLVAAGAEQNSRRRRGQCRSRHQVPRRAGEEELKAFTREEIVIMPFWNGRTFVLQGQGVPVDIAYIPGTMLVGNGFPVLRGGKFIEQTNRFCNITMAASTRC